MKKLMTVILASLISFGSVGVINPQPAQADHIHLYKLEYNQHGRILRTSVGLFYIGRSGDAIREVSGRRTHGYWEQSDSMLYVFIGDTMYYFSL